MPISMQLMNNEHVKSIPISIEISFNCFFFSATFSENFAKYIVWCSQVIEYSFAIFTILSCLFNFKGRITWNFNLKCSNWTMLLMKWMQSVSISKIKSKLIHCQKVFWMRQNRPIKQYSRRNSNLELRQWKNTKNKNTTHEDWYTRAIQSYRATHTFQSVKRRCLARNFQKTCQIKIDKFLVLRQKTIHW